jgi:hypothetical protein
MMWTKPRNDGGNARAAGIMIGEKAADLILGMQTV